MGMILGIIIFIVLISLVATFKRWFLPLWLSYERLFKKVFHLKTIDTSNPFFHYRIRPFKGRPLPMGNGDELRKGDLVAELHFDNQKLYQLSTESRSYVHLAIKLIRLAQKQLPKVEDLLNKPEFANVKAVYGISMINRGVKQLGFQVLDMPKGFMYYFTLTYLRFLVSVIHPSGRDRLKLKPDDLVPKIMIHSTAEGFTIKRDCPEIVSEGESARKGHMEDSVSPA